MDEALPVDVLVRPDERVNFDGSRYEQYSAMQGALGNPTQRVLETEFGLSELASRNVVVAVNSLLTAVRTNPEKEMSWEAQQGYFQEFMVQRSGGETGDRAWVEQFDDRVEDVQDGMRFAWEVLRYGQPEFADNQAMRSDVRELVTCGQMLEEMYAHNEGVIYADATSEFALVPIERLGVVGELRRQIEDRALPEAVLYQQEGLLKPNQAIRFRQMFQHYMSVHQPDKAALLKISQRGLGQQGAVSPREADLSVVGLQMSDEEVRQLQRDFYEFLQGLRHTGEYVRASGDELEKLLTAYANGAGELDSVWESRLAGMREELGLSHTADSTEMLEVLNERINSLSLDQLPELARLQSLKRELQRFLDTNGDEGLVSQRVQFSEELSHIRFSEGITSPEMTVAERELYDSLLRMYRAYFRGEEGPHADEGDSFSVSYSVQTEAGKAELHKKVVAHLHGQSVILEDWKEGEEVDSLRDYLSQMRAAMEEVAFYQAMHEHGGQVPGGSVFLKELVDSLSVARRWTSFGGVDEYRLDWFSAQPEARRGAENYRVIQYNNAPENYDYQVALAELNSLKREGAGLPYPPDDDGRARQRRFVDDSSGARNSFGNSSVVEYVD